MEDKRAQPRFDVCLTARWQGSTANYNARIADLSEGGCYVDTIVEVIVGETLFLQILTPDGTWFELQGVVAHHFPRLGFGVRFINLDEEQLRQVRSLIPNALQDSDKTLPQRDQIDLTSRRVM